MSQVLIVDDEPSILAALRTVLENSGIDVLIANNGEEAKGIIEQEKPDAIVSDIKMPEGNGIALLIWVKSNYPNIPFILMTGFSDIIEADQAFKLGASHFLTKPFHKEDILRTLDETLKQEAKSNERAEADESEIAVQFIPINLEEFISGQKIGYPLYVRLSKDKFLKVAHTGEDINLAQVREYKKRGMVHLYLDRESFSEYVELTLDLAKRSQKSTLSKEKKLALLKHAHETLIEDVFVNGIDQKKFDLCRSFIESTLFCIVDFHEIDELLQSLHDHTDYLYAHSLGVSLYGVMVAREIGWTLPSNQFLLAFAGIFHDIGKKEIASNLLQTPRHRHSTEERRIYESHPYRGMEILNSIKGVPVEVSHVAFQHHENNLGRGYPRRLSRFKIYTPAKIIAMVNEFCRHAIPNPESEGMSAQEAINQMEQFTKEHHDNVIYQALRKLGGLPVDAD